MENVINNSINNQNVNFSPPFYERRKSEMNPSNHNLNTSEISKNLDYNFTASGKYTHHFKNLSFVNHVVESTKSSNLNSMVKHDFKCQNHKMPKDIFLFEELPGFKIYDRICKFCESELKSKLKRKDIDTRDFTQIIMDEREKIKNIRKMTISSETVSPKTIKDSVNLLDELLYPIADEIIDVCNSFKNEILEKFNDSSKLEEMRGVKNFIQGMKLDNKEDPILYGIGDNEDLKIEYITLALFLIEFNGIDSKSADKGITMNYKNHILRLNELRTAILSKYSKWVRFLLGDFYDYIFKSEGVEIDYQFRNSIKINYSDDSGKISENSAKIINEKDEIIKSLSHEINRITEESNKLKLKFSEIDYIHKSELDLITQERDQLNNQIFDSREKFEKDIILQENKLQNSFNEKLKLESTLNSYLEEINILNRQLDILKFSSEGGKGEISELNCKITSLSNQIFTMAIDKDEAYNQISSLKEEIRNYQIDLNNYNNLKISAEAQVTDFKKKYEQILVIYGQVKDEYKLKINHINSLEFKMKELENNSGSQSNFYSKEIENNKITITNLNYEIEEMKTKLNLFNQYKDETIRLKLTLKELNDDYSKLNQTYDGLLSDIKQQLEVNQTLSKINFELQAKVDNHNRNLGGIDSNMKLQIENLTMEAISKQKLNYGIKTEHVIQCQGEIQKIRSKIDRIDSQKLYKSGVFDIANNFEKNQTENILRNKSVDFKVTRQINLDRSFDFQGENNRYNKPNFLDFSNGRQTNYRNSYLDNINSKLNIDNLHRSIHLDLGSKNNYNPISSDYKMDNSNTNNLRKSLNLEINPINQFNSVYTADNFSQKNIYSNNFQSDNTFNSGNPNSKVDNLYSNNIYGNIQSNKTFGSSTTDFKFDGNLNNNAYNLSSNSFSTDPLNFKVDGLLNKNFYSEFQASNNFNAPSGLNNNQSGLKQYQSGDFQINNNLNSGLDYKYDPSLSNINYSLSNKTDSNKKY